MQPVDIQKYKQLYLQTAEQYLQQYTSGLQAVQQNSADKNAISQMFIAIHSIKSQSLVMGYTEFGNFCKEVEAQLRPIKEGTVQLNPQVLNYLQAVGQKINTELRAVQTTGKDLGQTAPTSMIAPQHTGKKILLVEDDSFFEQFYAYKLKELGYEIAVAKNGEDGLQIMQQFLPNIVLLDLIMPIKDGFTVLAEKTTLPSIKNIPVIVFSTLGQEADIDRATKLGAVDFVNKSFFDFDKLVEKIKQQMI